MKNIPSVSPAHTPTPWEVSKGMVRSNISNTSKANGFALSTSKVPVADCIIRDGKTILNNKWEANAAFIVDACNNIEATRKELEETKKELEAMREMYRDLKHGRGRC